MSRYFLVFYQVIIGDDTAWNKGNMLVTTENKFPNRLEMMINIPDSDSSPATITNIIEIDQADSEEWKRDS